jgi:PAS domain S-box-containing protein
MLQFEHRLLDELPDAVIVTTLPGEVIYWNGGAERLFGYRRDEAVGRRLESLIVPATHGDALRHREEALSSGGATFETVRRHKDGTLLNIDASCRRLQADGGDALVVSCKRDVTDVRARRDANWIDAKFGEMLDATPDSLVIANASGRIVLANTQAEQLFGVDPKALCGTLVDGLLASRCRSRDLRLCAGDATRSLGADFDLFAVSTDGREFPVEIRLRRLDTELGPMTIAALRDISDRRRIERALVEQGEALRGASASTERFLGTMSHELRTPLNAIIGFTGTLLMRLPGPLTPDQERQLLTVQSSARQLLGMINALLELGRIDAGTLDLASEPVDVAALLEAVSRDLRPMAERNGLRLAFTPGAGDWTVRSDARVLGQVLQTLATELIELAGAGVLELSLQRVSKGVQACLHLREAPVAAASLASLCTVLDPVEAGQARRQDAAGLNLYLARRLAAALGGRLDCAPDAGGGSLVLQLAEC